MQYVRMPIEKESPEQFGYDRIRFNLTESSLRDRPLSDLGADPAELSGLLLAYGDHKGHPGLRERIAELSGVSPEEVLVTAGAASALFILHTALLERGDRVVAMRPNYGTNLETPRAIGADLVPLDLEFETGFRVDFDRLAELATPGTRLISLTCPHNPTGTLMTRAELDRALALAESRGARLLFDETYREMTHGEALPAAASLSDRALSVSSFSKTYGIPGIRVGWILCRDRSLLETLLAAKEQIGICGSVVDEELAYRALLRREEWMPQIRAHLRAALEIVRRWKAADDRFEWVEPSGGAVCFPRLRPDRGADPDRFHAILNERYGTFVGPGHWFERPRSYMRVGFGWPTLPELEEGLANLTRAARDAEGE